MNAASLSPDSELADSENGCDEGSLLEAQVGTGGISESLTLWFFFSHFSFHSSSRSCEELILFEIWEGLRQSTMLGDGVGGRTRTQGL